MRQFQLTFDNGLRCRYITQAKPATGQEHRPSIVWDGGDPGPDQLPRYQQWIHEVTQTLADEWKMPLMHIFMHTKEKHEVWVYEPGAKPKPVAFFS